jgi:hypothetical protein
MPNEALHPTSHPMDSRVLTNSPSSFTLPHELGMIKSEAFSPSASIQVKPTTDRRLTANHPLGKPSGSNCRLNRRLQHQ